MLRSSLAGRVALALAAVAIASSLATAALAHWLNSLQLAVGAGCLVLLPGILWLANRITEPWVQVLRAVRDGITSLRDHDFSISVKRATHDELGDLVAAYNSIGDLLRRERLDLYQRELLLDTMIQATPLALVLTNATGRIVFSNIAARQLFGGGHKIEGHEFATLVTPAGLREALAGGGDRLFTIQGADEPQTWHLSERRFLLNAQAHRLVLLKQLTRELAAQEVVVWKKVIRVIAHELNNSLAPISSLAHSGQLLAQQPDAVQLARVFSTIEERAAHLATFIDGYARFAKLPQPRRVAVVWSHFFARLEGTLPFTLDGALPSRESLFDPTQMSQVVINLLKNAAESGSLRDGTYVKVRDVAGGVQLEVADRGSGFEVQVLRDALLPFYSTKVSGTGLGLTLCREIVEAHGGRLSLANRSGGGAVVTVWLPDSTPTDAPV